MSQTLKTFPLSRVVSALVVALMLSGCVGLDLKPAAKVKTNVSVGTLVWRINKLERSRVFSSSSGDLAVDTLDNIMIRLQINLRNMGSEPYAYGEVCTLTDALGQEFTEHPMAKEGVDGPLLPRKGVLGPGEIIRFTTIFDVPKDSKRLVFNAYGQSVDIEPVKIPLELDLRF